MRLQDHFGYLAFRIATRYYDTSGTVGWRLSLGEITSGWEKHRRLSPWR
jgi:hypothetical protein